MHDGLAGEGAVQQALCQPAEIVPAAFDADRDGETAVGDHPRQKAEVAGVPGRRAQTSCLTSTAARLRRGETLFVEAFRPDPSRFDGDGRRVEVRPRGDGTTHVVRSRHDPERRTIDIAHDLGGDDGTTTCEVTLDYATPEELDGMAADAGLAIADRWHDWTGTPVRSASTDPVSVYRLDRSAV